MEPGGRVALVTGGARRLGAAIVRALAQAGARVAIHCNNSRTEAEALKRECPGSEVLSADLADPARCAGLVKETVERFGGLDILVNNAAVYRRQPLEKLDAEGWDEVLAVNLRAPFLLARDAGLRMRDAGRGGVIVNVTDWAVMRPYPAYLPYFAAKAGLASATAGLARALAPVVRVNAVAPGPMLLPADSPPEYEAAVVRATPLKRLGSTGPVASAVMFLIGNDFITGEILTVDGGRSRA